MNPFPALFKSDAELLERFMLLSQRIERDQASAHDIRMHGLIASAARKIIAREAEVEA